MNDLWCIECEDERFEQCPWDIMSTTIVAIDGKYLCTAISTYFLYVFLSFCLTLFSLSCNSCRILECLRISQLNSMISELHFLPMAFLKSKKNRCSFLESFGSHIEIMGVFQNYEINLSSCREAQIPIYQYQFKLGYLCRKISFVHISCFYRRCSVYIWSFLLDARFPQ